MTWKQIIENLQNVNNNIPVQIPININDIMFNHCFVFEIHMKGYKMRVNSKIATLYSKLIIQTWEAWNESKGNKLTTSRPNKQEETKWKTTVLKVKTAPFEPYNRGCHVLRECNHILLYMWRMYRCLCKCMSYSLV